MIEEAIVGFITYLAYAYIVVGIAWVFRARLALALWVAGGFALVRLILILNYEGTPSRVRGGLAIATILVMVVLVAHGFIANQRAPRAAASVAAPSADINEVR